MAALPHYPEFDCESENKVAKWIKYVNKLKNYFTAYNIEDDKRQKATLLAFVGEQMNDLVDELLSEQTTQEKNETHFDKLVLAGKTTSNQRTTPNITDLYFEKKHPKHRGLLSGIKRGSSYVPFHRFKCGNKIPGYSRLFIRKKFAKRDWWTQTCF